MTVNLPLEFPRGSRDFFERQDSEKGNKVS